MKLPVLRLKKNEDRRLRAGHVWIYSNEIDTAATPLKSFTPGQEVIVEAADKSKLGVAYVNPHSLITGRLFSCLVTDRLSIDFLAQRMKTALALRNRLYEKPFYRMVFGESDFLPGLIIDRFDDILSVQLNTAGMDTIKDSIISALREVLPSTQAILFRNDSPTRQQEGLDNYISAGLGTPPETVRLEENQTAFYAPLWEGQKTGWFYDHRLNRSRMKDYVKGKRVLDVFSYLGAWGIQAAKFGADEVTCVDSSPLAIQWIQKNAELNNVSNIVKTICDDAFDALKKLQQSQEKFDIVILDPPAFVKKQKDLKEGALAYQRINELALKLIVDDGILVSCSCSMHFSYNDLIQAIRRASLRAHCDLQIIERGHQAQDHPVHVAIPETDYLKMVVCRKS